MNISPFCLCGGQKELILKDEHTGSYIRTPAFAGSAAVMVPVTLVQCQCNTCGLLYSVESVGAELPRQIGPSLSS